MIKAFKSRLHLHFIQAKIVFPGRLLIIMILVCLSMGSWPGPVQAQEPTVYFEHISLEQGLSHSTVFSIVQDQSGFLWFGSQSGLNKYDGFNITVFKHDPNNLNSLSNDNAGNIFIDRAGIIWIGTWGGGLSRLDPRTEQFTTYLNDPANPNSLSYDRVQTIYEDRSGFLWIGTGGGGLDKLDHRTGTFTHYRHDPNDPTSLSHDRVWRMVEDEAGFLWVATSDGLNKFDPATETFTHYTHDPTDPTSLSHSLIRTLYIDQAGVLWVGTEEGLNKFDPETEHFTRYLNDPADPTSLSDNIINALLEDSAGNFWVGTSRGGLNKLDRQSGQFERYLNDPQNPASLSYNDIRWIYEDYSGVLWIATRGGGVNKFIPRLEGFTYLSRDPRKPNTLTSNDIRAIYVDRAKNLWLGTKGGGLNKLSARTGIIIHYLHHPDNPNSLSSNDVYTIHEDRQGQLWLGMAGGGLSKFDPLTETFTHYRHDPDNPDSLSIDDVNTIYEDRLGQLWIGTKGGGLNKLDPVTEQFTHYQYDPDDATSLGNNDVYSIYADPMDTLWVGTYGGGLNRLELNPNHSLIEDAATEFRPRTEPFTRYQYDPADPNSLSNNDIYTIYPDDLGQLWLGTANGGLNKFDPVSGQFTHFTQAEGLASDVVYGILGDAQGCLWLSTSKGLSKFNPQTGRFANYGASDGLVSIGFNEGAYHQSQEGLMFFGGINGLLYFDPAEINESSYVPPVVLTALTFPNKEINLTGPIDQVTEITLPYEDHTFSIEFAVLDYTNPAKNRYAYKLEGFDADWIGADTRRFAAYTNLDSGSYIFRVKGANQAGVWNETGVSLKITITPPFWERWWFRAGAILLGLGVVLGGYTIRVRGMKIQRKKLEALVTERTGELTATNERLQTLMGRLQAELTLAHEIQASLLPRPRPNWPCLDVICYSASAREVGGDFYAYHTFPVPASLSLPEAEQNGAGHFAIAVGDATGKGMAAALLMAVSLASFQSTLEQALGPAQLLAQLDRAIWPYTRTRRQNCALCYMELESFASPAGAETGGILRVANAGCISPFIRRIEGVVEWVDIGGPPLGVGLGAQDGYAEVEVSLRPGDLVILTSDGVVEAKNATGEMFGFERLEQAIKSGPQIDAEAMLEHMKTEVAAFVGQIEPHDDMTIVVVQV